MVKGLDVFREFFAGYAGQFVLIGGAAMARARRQSLIRAACGCSRTSRRALAHLGPVPRF